MITADLQELRTSFWRENAVRLVDEEVHFTEAAPG
jgi:hypothetical protein